MEPNRQVEIQLGHMCNNRCVFCVSGQRTEMREAFPLEGDPIKEKISEGFQQGSRKLTILGGEPTIQPEFLNIVQHAVDLGFEEIVIFTNGVKTARLEFLDEILATGGNFTFRFSFQGATMMSHERTTKKLGSFNRLVQSMKNVALRNKPLTVNMCVVQSNYQSIAHFPKLILPYGATQLHLDMIRPLDAGVRTEQELRDMLPRYSDMVPYLEQMIAGFPEGFDVNIGNLPYCIAPGLARFIHHDGEQTFTIAVDDKDALSEAWDKYEVKRRDKLKIASCRECLFDDQCSGVFDTYRQFYGLDELIPIGPALLRQVDPERRLFTMHLKPILKSLSGWTPPAPFAHPTQAVNSIDHEVRLSFESLEAGSGQVVVALRRPGTAAANQIGNSAPNTAPHNAGGVAATDAFSMHLLEAPDCGPRTVSLLRALLARLCQGSDLKVIHPVAEDAGFLSAAPRRLATGPGTIDPRLATRLKQLRDRAPFGALNWRDLQIHAGREAKLTLSDPRGGTVNVSLALKGTQVAGGYQLTPGSAASPELVDGLRALMGVLSRPS